MKKRICLVLALILLLPTLLIGYGFSLPSYYSETYYAQLPDMVEKLEQTEGRKIMIVGGSNVAFGVDSAELTSLLKQHGFDFTVCNFGLYAALGTDAMLSLSEDCLREGDFVVLAIEPTDETFSTYFGATAMLKCAEDAPGLLLRLNKEQRSAVVGNYLEYLQERSEIRRTGILPQGDGAYAKASFDENGDMVYPREGNAMTMGYDTATPIDLSALSIEPAFAERVNSYIDSARKKGAVVVLSFAPMNRSAVTDTSEEALYSYYCLLQDTFHCAIISNPNNYLLEKGWFYDSNFHLNSAGMTLRTQQLCSDLLTYFGCSDRLDFALPVMPASIAKTAVSEGAAGDFLFEPLGDTGLTVVGLSETGKTREVLTLPAYAEGKAVVGIAADALGSNEILTELTLPATIERIPDGLFSGCTALTRVTLLHTDTTPAVGNGLLEGAPNLTIWVSEEVYRLFRDGAGCAVNPWEQYLDNLETY